MASLWSAILFRIRSSLCSANLPSHARPRVFAPVFKSAINALWNAYANCRINAKWSVYLKDMCWRLPLRRCWWNPVRRGSRRGETCLPVQAGPRAEAKIRIRLIRPVPKTPPELDIPAGVFVFVPHAAGSVSELKPSETKRDDRRPSLPALLIDPPNNRLPRSHSLEKNGNGTAYLSVEVQLAWFNPGVICF